MLADSMFAVGQAFNLTHHPTTFIRRALAFLGFDRLLVATDSDLTVTRSNALNPTN